MGWNQFSLTPLIPFKKATLYNMRVALQECFSELNYPRRLRAIPSPSSRNMGTVYIFSTFSQSPSTLPS